MRDEDKRPFFRELQRRHKFDVLRLERLSRTSGRVVLKMLRAHPVARCDAEKVLRALSEMTGQHYTLETVRVVIKHESR